MSQVIKYINRFKVHIQNIGIYLLASLIPMAVSMVCNPFVAKNMSPTDYAIAGYYNAFGTLLTPLINFYLIHYYTKRFFELTDNDRKIMKATIFKMLIFLSFILFLVSLLGIYIYTVCFNKDSQLPFFPYAIMALITIPLSGTFSLLLVELRMKRDSKKFFKYNVFKGLSSTLLLLVFVVLFKTGALGYLGANLVIIIALFLLVLYQERDLFNYSFDKKIAKEAVLFCWPLVLAAMLTFFSNGYDKVLLERAGDVTMLGIYSVGVSIAGHLGIFSTSINDTFQPDIYENIVKRNFRRCAKFIALKLLLLSIVVGLFIICAPFVVHILTYGRYDASTPFAQILAISSVTSMLYYSMSQVTIAFGYSSITLLNKILGSALSILSFSLLIPAYGAYGAAWGVVLSFLYFFLGNVVLVLLKRKQKKI